MLQFKSPNIYILNKIAFVMPELKGIFMWVTAMYLTSHSSFNRTAQKRICTQFVVSEMLPNVYIILYNIKTILSTKSVVSLKILAMLVQPNNK